MSAAIQPDNEPKAVAAHLTIWLRPSDRGSALTHPPPGDDRRYDFRPTPLLTARRFMDGEFVRSESKKQSEPGKTFERGTDALFTADPRPRLGK
jgi:hypothetical protein